MPDSVSGSADASDAAWATLVLPLPAERVVEFLQDTELLLRINPCLEFDRLRAIPDGAWHIAGRNESNGRTFETEVRRAPSGGADFVLGYADGIKRETRFALAPDAQGTQLKITETYATPAGEELAQRLAEVDRSLVPWAAALRVQLLRRARWGGVPGYRWLMERFWLGMPPRQRRVAWLIVWTTALEFLVFLAVLAVYLAA